MKKVSVEKGVLGKSVGESAREKSAWERKCPEKMAREKSGRKRKCPGKKM